jgi:lipopolysaccharide export system protein LptA
MAVTTAGYGQSYATIDYDAQDSFSVLVRDSVATALVGEVIFHHNGALITCDSAVLYNSRNYVECFNNVIINKDSTYVYGDRADFNGETNIAHVFAPIIKTIDGDVTMYSYDMEFNTLTNIGRYTTGGTISQKDNLMESRQAIYHADERQLYLVDQVVARNEEYIIQTDSMGYNFDTEVIDFYRPARIWNSDGDFLTADRGSYDRINDTYRFTENSYILTADNQEVMADSITYIKSRQLAYLFNNIQLYDPEQSAYLFGDYGVYFEESGQAILTDNPSGIGYDNQGAETDSVFLRGDTIFLHAIPREETFDAQWVARLRLPGREELDTTSFARADSLLLQRPDSLPPDSLSRWGHLYGADADTTLLEQGMRGIVPGQLEEPPEALADSLGQFVPATDSLAVPVPLADSLGVTANIPPTPPDSLAVSGVDSLTLSLPDSLAVSLPDSLPPDSLAVSEIQTPPDSLPLTKRQIRRQERLERRRARMREYAVEQGLIPADSLGEAMDSLAVDSSGALADSLGQGVLETDSLSGGDSLQRIIRSVGNVKIYRSDLQAVCDSLVAFSIDTTAHFYVRPILWNENNQVTAQDVHLYSRDEQLVRAEFVGGPIMAQWVIDSLFNQVTGDRIEVFFRDNEIQRMEVLGNAKSYYYEQEADKPSQIGAFMDITSRDMIFRFDSTQIRQIVPIMNVKTTQYPMLRIPEDHTQRFPGFSWMPGLRPMSRHEVVDREIRPSQQEASRSIPYPRFQITDRMQADKKRFIEQDLWRDRNDTLSIDPAFFFNLVPE